MNIFCKKNKTIPPKRRDSFAARSSHPHFTQLVERPEHATKRRAGPRKQPRMADPDNGPGRHG